MSERVWKYAVNRWLSRAGSGHHYHVTLFPDCQLRDVFSVQSGVSYQQKFNTQDESEKFIKKVRRSLGSQKVSLKLVRKELDL